MFNLFDELWIGMATKKRQDRLDREAVRARLLAEAQVQRGKSQKGRIIMQFLTLALKAFGTNSQMNWKL